LKLISVHDQRRSSYPPKQCMTHVLKATAMSAHTQVTWPVNSWEGKTIAHMEFPNAICLFTVQPSGYDDD